MTTKTRTKPPAQEKQMLSVHNMAEKIGIDLTPGEAKLIGSGLVLISEKRGLPTDNTKQRTTKDNPNYDPNAVSVAGKNKKKLHQSYTVRAYSSDLTYDFQQLCIIYGLL